MVIRCERCSTLYDLDEGLLSRSGSQVQCTRCQHVFTAYPAGAQGAATAVAPAQPPRASAGAGPAAPSLPRARSATARLTPSGASKPEPKPVRTAPPPVYRPAPAPAGAAPPPVTRAPVLRRDAVGAFEARLRRSARMRWLAPILAGAAVVAIAAGWALLARRGDEGSARARREALALAALDDGASLDKALARLEELERRTPQVRAVVAERALVQVLRASAIAEEGETLAARRQARSADRERLRREQPPGWEQAERAAASEVQTLEPEVRAREERSRALATAALDALRRAQAEAGDSPEIARGLALHHALAGGRERLEPAHAPRGSDPWLELAAAGLDARHPERASRERAVAALRALASTHPELLRGRFLLARTQAALGRSPEAVATLDALLAANPRHEAAKRLRDDLLAPPAALREGAVAASPADASVKPAPQPRKKVSPPAPPPAAAPVETSPAQADAAPPSPAATPAPAEAAATRTTPAATDAPAGATREGAAAPVARPPIRSAPLDPEPLPAQLDGG